MLQEPPRTRKHNARARAAVFFAALATTIAVVAILAPVALDWNAPVAAVVLSVVSILGLAVLAYRG
jgi:hypothetical protein